MPPPEAITLQSRDTLLLESLDEPIVATRPDGTIVAWSRGAEILYGWPRAEAVGRNIDQLLNLPSSTPHTHLDSPEARWTGELHPTRRDGTSITVNSRQHLVTQPDGTQIRVACDQDISAHRAPSGTPGQEDNRLVDLRERFQFSADAGQIGYWFCDLPFDDVIWDARVREHFWLTEESGKIDMPRFYSLLHPDDREPTREAIRESIERHARYDVQYRTMAPDGRHKWIRAIGRTAYAPDGTPVRFDGITQDITSLKRAEAELRESQKQLTTFADSIPPLAWMADSEGYIFWYNRRWFEYTGTTQQQMEGWGWQSVHDPSILSSVIEQWTHSIRTGNPLEMVFPLRSAAGEFRSFLVRANPALDERGEIVRWFGTCTEVDELERTRNELQQSQHRIRIALQNIPVTLYTTDRDLRYTWVYRPHPGYAPEKIIGNSDLDVDPVKFAEIHAIKQSVLDTGIPIRREFAIFIDGKNQVFDYIAEPLRDNAGNIVGLTVAALDITHMRLAEEALRKSEKLAVVGRLAASIAHEINNPLEAVVSLIYVARNMATDEELRGYLDTAEQELYRVAQVVTQSLRFHRQSTAASEVRISSLMDSALTLYRGRLKHSAVELTTSYSDTQPLLCLSSELRQVFANLIGNAFEATRTGRIELRAHPATHPRSGAPGVRAIVADTGHGIDPKTLAHLFEAFVTTKGEFGTGLGLWVSAEILKRHHATINVKSSTVPGHSGTIFSIFFPLSGPDPVQQTRSDAPLPQL
jgi:PAS domain S-box-containing protein